MTDKDTIAAARAVNTFCAAAHDAAKRADSKVAAAFEAATAAYHEATAAPTDRAAAAAYITALTALTDALTAADIARAAYIDAASATPPVFQVFNL